jgi:catecholate siderophore receptor
MRYVPGISVHQGENNRDQVIIRGNSSSADFFINGVRDDVQYYRDLYNVDRVEALKGPNALIFGRGGAGGVVNRVMKEAGSRPVREFLLQAGMFDNRRITMDVDQPVNDKVAVRLNGVYENSDSFRDHVDLNRYGLTPTFTIAPSDRTKVTLRYEYLDDSRVADRASRPTRARRLTSPPQRSTATRTSATSERRQHRIGHGRTPVQRLHASEQHIARELRPRLSEFVARRRHRRQETGGATYAYNNATGSHQPVQSDGCHHDRHDGLSWRHTVLAGAEFGHQLTDNFRNTGFFNNTATSILVPA